MKSEPRSGVIAVAKGASFETEIRKVLARLPGRPSRWKRYLGHRSNRILETKIETIAPAEQLKLRWNAEEDCQVVGISLNVLSETGSHHIEPGLISVWDIKTGWYTTTATSGGTDASLYDRTAPLPPDYSGIVETDMTYFRTPVAKRGQTITLQLHSLAKEPLKLAVNLVVELWSGLLGFRERRRTLSILPLGDARPMIGQAIFSPAMAATTFDIAPQNAVTVEARTQLGGHPHELVIPRSATGKVKPLKLTAQPPRPPGVAEPEHERLDYTVREKDERFFIDHKASPGPIPEGARVRAILENTTAEIAKDVAAMLTIRS